MTFQAHKDPCQDLECPQFLCVRARVEHDFCRAMPLAERRERLKKVFELLKGLGAGLTTTQETVISLALED